MSTGASSVNAANPVANRAEAVEALLPYVEQRLAEGDYLTRITRHMLGLYHGCHGGRHWRRMLSEDARRDGAGIELLREALELIGQAAATRAAAE
jgi:tRNA-dihydrouridine synthase A